MPDLEIEEAEAGVEALDDCTKVRELLDTAKEHFGVAEDVLLEQLANFLEGQANFPALKETLKRNMKRCAVEEHARWDCQYVVMDPTAGLAIANRYDADELKERVNYEELTDMEKDNIDWMLREPSLGITFTIQSQQLVVFATPRT